MTDTPETPISNSGDDPGEITIPRIEEELEIDRRELETGRVRVLKTVQEEIRTVSEPVVTREVEIRRLEKNEILQEPAQTRIENGTTIIPVMEEIVVVTKQLVLREEIHLVPIEKTSIIQHEISVQKEAVDIERLSPEE